MTEHRYRDPYGNEWVTTDTPSAETLASYPAGTVETPMVPIVNPEPPSTYQISKTTPWLRMTDDEAELITGAMQQANARQKAIYDAAAYLSSGDPLWSTLHDMLALTLGSVSRANQLLAPET